MHYCTSRPARGSGRLATTDAIALPFERADRFLDSSELGQARCLGDIVDHPPMGGIDPYLWVEIPDSAEEQRLLLIDLPRTLLLSLLTTRPRHYAIL